MLVRQEWVMLLCTDFFSGVAYFAIVYMIKFGDLAKLAKSAGGSVEKAHNTLFWFVLVGWAIYPLGIYDWNCRWPMVFVYG